MDRAASQAVRQTLLALAWRDGAPAGRVRGASGPSTLVPVHELSLRYRVPDGARRRCLGHRSERDGAAVDCDREPATPTTRKCERCQTKDGVFAAAVHQVHRNRPEDLDRRFRSTVDRPHRLYLAAFRDGSMKVGVTAEGRGTDRLFEQGAWSARFVAAFPTGVDVRLLEDRITAELDVDQSVSIGRKLRGLLNPVDDSELDRRLDRLAERVGPLLDTVMVEAEPIDERWAFVTTEPTTWEGLVPYPLDLGSGCHELEILGLCGRAAVVQSDAVDQRFVVDLGRLFGIEVEPGRFGSDTLAFQGSLF